MDQARVRYLQQSSTESQVSNMNKTTAFHPETATTDLAEMRVAAERMDQLKLDSEKRFPAVTVVAKAVHPPWNEGTRVIARNIALAAQKAGYATRTISLSSKAYAKQQDEYSTRVKHIQSRLSYGITADYLYLRQVAQAINRSNGLVTPEVVHLIGAPLALAPFTRNRTRRVVAHVTLSRQAYLSAAEKLRAAFGWRVFDRWVDAYACTSGQIKRDLLRRGYNPEKLHVVAPPIDVQRFERVDRVVARGMLGLDADAFVIAYVGTVSPLRFPADDVMKALSLASEEIPRLRLEVFAPVLTHGRNIVWAEENVSRAAQGLGLSMGLHLQDLTDLQKALVYSAADVTLLPFTAPVAVEPPLTLLEAMSCRAIVAVAPYANRSNIVVEGRNGITFSDASELATQLKGLYSLSLATRESLGEEARSTVLKKYSFGAALEDLSRLWAYIGLQEAVDCRAANLNL